MFSSQPLGEGGNTQNPEPLVEASATPSALRRDVPHPTSGSANPGAPGVKLVATGAGWGGAFASPRSIAPLPPLPIAGAVEPASPAVPGRGVLGRPCWLQGGPEEGRNAGRGGRC